MIVRNIAGPRRLRFTDDQRRRLAAKAKALGRRVLQEITTIVTPDTFVVVEMSNPRSTPLELQAIASNYGVPIFPIIKKGAKPFGMFSGLRKFRWVSRPVEYKTTNDLIARLCKRVIKPAMEERRRLAAWKRRAGAP